MQLYTVEIKVYSINILFIWQRRHGRGIETILHGIFSCSWLQNSLGQTRFRVVSLMKMLSVLLRAW